MPLGKKVSVKRAVSILFDVILRKYKATGPSLIVKNLLFLGTKKIHFSPLSAVSPPSIFQFHTLIVVALSVSKISFQSLVSNVLFPILGFY